MKKIVAALIIILFLAAGFTLRDMLQARNMAITACGAAVKGKALEEYLTAFSHKDYRIIMGMHECIVVPRKGMGRYRCVVVHDGRFITDASTCFRD